MKANKVDCMKQLLYKQFFFGIYERNIKNIGFK